MSVSVCLLGTSRITRAGALVSANSSIGWGPCGSRVDRPSILNGPARKCRPLSGNDTFP